MTFFRTKKCGQPKCDQRIQNSWKFCRNHDGTRKPELRRFIPQRRTVDGISVEEEAQREAIRRFDTLIPR